MYDKQDRKIFSTYLETNRVGNPVDEAEMFRRNRRNRIVLNEAKTIKNDPELKEMYDKFNQELFSQYLKTLPSDIKVGWKSSKRKAGTARGIKDRYGVVTPEYVAISDKFDFTQDQLKGVLVHEMIHVFAMMEDKVGGHGSFFKALVDDLDQYTDFKIPYKEIDIDYKEGIGKKRGVVLTKVEGRPAICVWNKKSFDRLFNKLWDNYKEEIKYQYDAMKKLQKEIDSEFELFMGYAEDELLEEFPVKRKLPKHSDHPRYKLSNDEYDKIKSIMEVEKKVEFE